MIELPPGKLLPGSFTYRSLAQPIFGEEERLYNYSSLPQHIISAKPQQLLQNECFCFVTEASSGEIIYSNGIHLLLGYPDKAFTIKKMCQILHPAHKAVQPFYAAALFNIIKSPLKKTFLQQQITITCAIKNISGFYWYCKRNVIPLYNNDAITITALLHEFTIVKEYSGELFSVRLSAAEKTLASQYSSTLKNLFRQYSSFSGREYTVLQHYAGNTAASNETASNLLAVKKATIETYNQRIMRKTEDVFHYTAASAKNAAVYFAAIGVV